VSDFDLSGQTALVTGGSRGIGAGSAAALASAGARVVLVGRNAETLSESADRIRTDGGTADVLPWDVGNGDTAAALVGAAVRLAGQIDILVHAAGNQIRRPAVDFSADDWDAILDLHLRAAFLLAQATARHLLERQAGGSIVFIGSLNSQRVGLADIVAYSAAKSGLLGLARTLSTEWSPHGIRVNTVLPGFVATELTRDVDGTPQRQALIDRAPIGRLGTPADIGSAVSYLASPAAGFITGETLTVDGGWSHA
jgi:2-dehydro-3-deoxy-D-gluconate 5-dehydrogenase